MGILSSTFKVNVKDSKIPLFTTDYVRDAGTGVPSAHLNVHADRDDTVMAMIQAGRVKRGKSRTRRMERGIQPRLGDVHFPLGGHRFRPCVEDVLEMLILEFGIDCHPNYVAALAAGRKRFRQTQLAAAVSDDPETAARKLESLGYEFLRRPDPLPTARDDRLAAL